MPGWLLTAWPILLGAALLIAGALIGGQPRWAAALLGGFGAVSAQVAVPYLAWTGRHPGGTLSTYLTAHHIHLVQLLLTALILTGLNWGALWLLAHLTVPRTLAGPQVNLAVHLAVPAGCVALVLGEALATPWPVRAALAVLAAHVSLAIWTAGVSGTLIWQRPDPVAANIRREWRVPLSVTAALLLTLLVALI